MFLASEFYINWDIIDNCALNAQKDTNELEKHKEVKYNIFD